MAVHCSVDIKPISTEAFTELDYRVMHHAFESQNEMGRLADERIYQADLAMRLQDAGLVVRRELELVLTYDKFRKPFYIDLLVDEQGVYELKVVKSITSAHVGQLQTYLQLLDLPRGKIIDFGGSKVESRFVNATIRTAQRRDFVLVDADYRGTKEFMEVVVGLLRDWGTSLTLSLYQEPLVFLLGGSHQSEAMLPMWRNGVHLGNQRFLLASPETAFKLTALTRDQSAFENQIARLLRHSPLYSIHWINIQHEEVTIKTFTR